MGWLVLTTGTSGHHRSLNFSVSVARPKSGAKNFQFFQHRRGSLGRPKRAARWAIGKKDGIACAFRAKGYSWYRTGFLR